MSNARSPTDLEGQEYDTEQRRLEALRAQALRLQDLEWVLSSPAGRRFVWGQLADAGVFRSSIGQTDALTNFNEGKRAAGLKLLNEIVTNFPDVFADMMRDQNA